MKGRQLFDQITPHLQRCLDQGQSMGVLWLGLRGLRQFNIQHGYEAGEILLTRAQGAIRSALRPDDVVSQAAPGEFVVLLPAIRDGNHALLAASRLLRQFEQPIEVHGRPVLASVAIGAAVCPEHGRDADALCRRAESAYEAAANSSDRMALSPDQDRSDGINPLLLREAIQASRLEVYLQPLWDIARKRVVGAESLARWNHPGIGDISPTVFVDLAERSGMVAEFTRWSIHATLQHLAAARAAGLDFPVSINLSGKAFAERGLVEQLLGALRLWDIPPGSVVVEVTETAIIQDPTRGATALHSLHAEGIQVAIDDFGIGNASFAYLRQFPATELKIDRSFITGMLADVRSMQLARAMVDMAHHLEMRVVAEGVEDRATLDRLAEMHCDFAQGYAIGRPEPAAAFIERLATRERPAATGA